MLGRFRRFRRRRRKKSVQKVVLAHQGDGLGERLNALLNAMRLSRLLGVDYRFSWPMKLAKDPHHAIAPADEVFTTAFLDAHLAGTKAVHKGFDDIAGPDDDLDAIRAQLSASRRGLRVRARPLSTRIDPVAVPEITEGFATEFDAVGFHPQIVAAVEAARAFPLGNDSVGIHLRAGDILYGRYRTLTHSWYKIISAPVARSLIRRHRDAGHEVIVFGQDAELIAELCSSTGATDASVLREAQNLSRTGEAIFDLVLLSRCDHIIAGHSGFAIQAASISGRTVENHLDLVPPEEAIEITRADMAESGDLYAPVHREFAWWAAFYAGRHELDDATATELLTAAFEADPTNPRSRLHLAARHHARGRRDLGDDVLVDALRADVTMRVDPTLASVLLFSLITVRGFDSIEIHDDILGAAEAGPGPATIYRAGLHAQQGDEEAAERDVAAFLAYAADEPRLSELDALEEMVRETIRVRLEWAGKRGWENIQLAAR